MMIMKFSRSDPSWCSCCCCYSWKHGSCEKPDQAQCKNHHRCDTGHSWHWVFRNKVHLYKNLSVQRQCAQGMPHDLMDAQKRDSIEWCQYEQEKFDAGQSEATWDIIDGDETRFYQSDPKTKLQSSVWMFLIESLPIKFNRTRGNGKQMGSGRSQCRVVHTSVSTWSLQSWELALPRHWST